MTAGMSGREIAKLGVAWQAAGYTSEDGLLTQEMVLSRCEDAIKQHKQKVFYINYLIVSKLIGCFNLTFFQMDWMSEKEKNDSRYTKQKTIQ